jgi:tryptophan-rich sensory protein
MEEELVALIVLACAYVGCMLSLCVWGTGIGGTSRRVELAYMPASRAFGIWSVIFLSAIVSILVQLMQLGRGEHPVSANTNAFHAGAWLSAALWAPFFTRLQALEVAAAALIFCVACSCAGAYSLRGAPWQVRVLHGTPLSLLAGWTLAAAALSVGIAVLARKPRAVKPVSSSDPESGLQPSPTMRRDYSIIKADRPLRATDNTPIPLVLALGASTLALAANDPVLPLSTLVAVFFQRPTCYAVTSAAVLLAVAVTGVARLFVA